MVLLIEQHLTARVVRESILRTKVSEEKHLQDDILLLQTEIARIDFAIASAKEQGLTTFDNKVYTDVIVF